MAQAPFRIAALTATGDITLGATGQVTITASNGNIATSGTGDFGATTVTSLDASSGGITNAGAIAGASTIDASGTITGGSLTDGAFSTTAGAVTGVTTLNASGLATVGSLTDGTLTIDGSGNITGATAITASGALTGGSLTDGVATISGGTGSGFASLTSDLFDDGAGATVTGGIVTGSTVTDGTFTTTAGAVSGVTTLGMSDVLTIGSGGTTYAFPTARGTANQILKIDGSGNLTFQDDGGAAGPGGASGNIQFNDGAGGFSGEASLNWDSTNEVLELGNGGTTYAGLASNTQAVAASATAAIDTFAQTSYVAAKYLITAENTSSNEVHTIELLLSGDGTTTNFVPFADVFTGAGPLFSVAVSGTGTISIDVTNLDGANGLNVQFMRTTLA